MVQTKINTEQQEAIERLREWLQPGDTVFTILRRVSPSGMNRVIDLVHFRIIEGKVEPRTLGFDAAKALGWRFDHDKEGIRVGGAGMDMGFHLVYSLGQVLFGDGYKLNQRWL